MKVTGKLGIGKARQGAKGRPIALAIAPGAGLMLEAALEGARPCGASRAAVCRLSGPADGADRYRWQFRRGRLAQLGFHGALLLTIDWG